VLRRLRRIEQHARRSLDDPAASAELYVALEALQRLLRTARSVLLTTTQHLPATTDRRPMIAELRHDQFLCSSAEHPSNPG
jgi:hypothetical protein